MVLHPPDRADLGRFAESIAADFLERAGGTVVARNVVTPIGELDLIVDWGGEPAVVEVRSARGVDGAERLFTTVKEMQVRRVAARLDPPVYRIDVVTVLAGPDGLKLRWHRRV